MSLEKYNRKRDFDETPEPKGKTGRQGKDLIFVVQRHQASHLHYDVRLEMNGVLRSWAVPKGPSLNPKDKRLAMMVEDHPVSYASFEGTIPEGNYGAGIVEIWDSGTYELSPDNKGTGEAAIDKGSLKFILHGKKLRGRFALIKLKKGEENAWLLVKDKDEFAVAEYDSEDDTKIDKTVKQKKTLPQRTTKRYEAITRQSSAKSIHISDAITPMLASLTKVPFTDKNWIFEIKWDGYRAIAECRKKGSRLYSRNAVSFGEKYPLVYEAIQSIKTPMILDGEIVVLDEEGKPDFQKLQLYAENNTTPIIYYVFDILSYKGKDITHKPLWERKTLLEKVLPQNDVIRYCDHIEGEGEAFFKEMQKRNLEGMIAKQKESVYLPGERSESWLKVKHQKIDEAIIAGFTKPEGSRKYFGSLVLGQYKEGRLIYVGHTGTGFNSASLKALYDEMKPLVSDTNPFGVRVPVNNAVTWVTPKLVANIHYTQITAAGIMRHPVFHGLRIDKTVGEMKGELNQVEDKTSSIEESHGSNMITVGKVQLALTNTNKVFFPDDGYTKGDIIRYYQQMAPYILPYLKNRPQSMRRNPNGIGDAGFFQKDAGDNVPSWVKTVSLHSESNDRNIDYILCNNEATLLYMANLGCIELNPWNSRVKKEEKPDYLILDLDPSDKNTFEDVIEAALIIKELLDKAGADCYCKTSGASGLHVYVPLGAGYSYDEARAFAEIIARLAVEKAPELVTIERTIANRENKLYIDYLQNKKGQTLAAAYSVRPKRGATVSTPLEWKEVKKGLHPSQFTIKNMLQRVGKKGDLFLPVLDKGINLKRCLKNIEP